MSTSFDTLTISKRLQGNGFTQQQAEAIAVEMQEISHEDHLVTKEYLDEKLRITHAYLDGKLEGMRIYLHSQIDKLTLKIGAMLFAGFGFLAGIQFFGH
jgi:hypothetical protein